MATDTTPAGAAPTPGDTRLDEVDAIARYYGDQRFAVAFTKGIAGDDAKRVTAAGWDKTAPLSTPDFAVGLIRNRAATRNPVIVLRASNLIGIECDSEADLARIQALDLPPTLTVRSSSEYKRHFYFRPPASLETLPYVAFRFEAGKITADTGRYFVAPPAQHPSGCVYGFLPGLGPGETEIAELSEDVYRQLVDQARTEAIGLRKTLEIDANAKVREGNRRDMIFRFACAQRRWGATREAIAAACHAFNETRCDPPVERHLVETQVDGAMKQTGGQELADLNGRPAPDEHGAEHGNDAATAFTGLTHDEVLALQFEAERFLLDDLIPKGAVGTVAGVPETHKSWLAQAIAIRVAAGTGQVLGRQVQQGGPVGYIWQDDSTREEAERVKLFDRVHESPPDLPLRWFLNEGIKLPQDIPRLRATVEKHGLVLLILDSFYNVLFGLDLKDEAAEQVVATLKRDISDPTGCTVLIVDHMPWANDTNRQRLRAYGGVFKGAATRFGIYIDAPAKKLWIEARGNNMRGFQRTLAEWDEDLLELRLIESDDRVSNEDYEQRILDYLTEHPGALTKDIDSITGKDTELRAARQRLLQSGAITNSPAQNSGRGNPGKCWNLASEASSKPVPLPGTDKDPETTTNSPFPVPVPIGDGLLGRPFNSAADEDLTWR